MIRIRKGAAPRKLTREGLAKTAIHIGDHGADPAAYANGSRRFSFAAGIYGHNSVREALGRAQHEKCCYCECKLEKPYALFHVDHWRPKSRSRQDRGAPALVPGYFWLVYDWDNILLACHFCNSPNKGDLFPLVDETVRARADGDDLTIEDPLFLKPDGPEDPQDHISFHEELPYGTTERGRVTVRLLGLDNPKHELRLRLLTMLKWYRDVVERYHDDPAPSAVEFVEHARRFIEGAVRPEAPFSAMAATFLRRNPLPP